MTTLSEITEVCDDVETFCRYARTLVRSYAPVGFGQSYEVDRDQIVEHLNAAAKGFARMIARAQKHHQWAVED